MSLVKSHAQLPTASPLDRPEHAADHRRWFVLAVALASTFLVISGVSVVNLAIPSMQSDLHAGYAEIELVVAAYSLMYAVFLITGGRLGDIAGRKHVLMAGLALFTIAVIAGGSAPSAELLITARAVQGLGAAMIYPQILSIIEETFDGAERRFALGLFGATIGVALVAGQLIGGALIQLDPAGLGWRSALLILAPIGIGAMVASALFMTSSRSEGNAHLDLGGTGILAVALVLLILPLLMGQTTGWPAWMLAMLAACLPMLALFIWYEARTTAKGRTPLLSLRLFRQRAFVVGMAIGVVYFTGALGFAVYTSITLQTGLGFSAMRAGVAFAPAGVALCLGSLLAPKLVPRLGRRILSLGYLILAGGLVAVLISLAVAGTGLTVWTLAPALMIVGAGQGLSMSPLIGSVLSGVRPNDTGAAAGALTTSFQLGQTLGIAAVGIVYFAFATRPGPHQDQYLLAYRNSVAVLAGLAVLLFLLVFLLPRPSSVVRSNVFLERTPSRLAGLVHSFYFATGGRGGERVMRRILDHHLAELVGEDEPDATTPVTNPGGYLVRQYEHATHRPMWYRYLAEEAFAVGSRHLPHEVDRRHTVERQVAEVREHQQAGLLTAELDPRMLQLAAYALSHYPQLLPQLTRLATGLEADSAEFRQQWKGFLQQLGGRLGD